MHKPNSLIKEIMNIAEEHERLVLCLAIRESGISAWKNLLIMGSY